MDGLAHDLEVEACEDRGGRFDGKVGWSIKEVDFPIISYDEALAKSIWGRETDGFAWGALFERKCIPRCR